MFRGLSVAGALSACLMAGCGGGHPTADVSGSVTLDGRPLADAEVKFVPTSDANLGMLVGTTDAGGRFSISHDAAGGSASVGSYAVLVSKPTGGAGGEMGAVVKNDVTAVYQDRNRTPLKADLKAGTNALPPFALSTSAAASGAR